MTQEWSASEGISRTNGMKKLRYTVRCWCDENGAEGTYRFKAFSRVDAERQAKENFVDHCLCAAALYVPPAENVHTEIVEVGI